MRAVRMVRRFGLRAAAASACLILSSALSCASAAAPAPKPAPPDPLEQTVSALTESLKLDPAQQQKTRELLKEMTARDERIRTGWANGQRVRPEMLVNSRGLFERDFVALLTPEQRKIFVENRTRLLLQLRGARS